MDKSNENPSESMKFLKDGYAVAYNFSHGFRDQAEHMHKWLNHYGFSVDQVITEKHDIFLTIPDHQVSQLRLLQKTRPALWGNPPAESNETTESVVFSGTEEKPSTVPSIEQTMNPSDF